MTEQAGFVPRHRQLGWGWLAVLIIFSTAGTLLAINQLFNLRFFAGRVLIENRYLYLLLALFFSLTFLIFPATRRAPRDRVPWYDVVLFAAAATGIVVGNAAKQLAATDAGSAVSAELDATGYLDYAQRQAVQADEYLDYGQRTEARAGDVVITADSLGLREVFVRLVTPPIGLNLFVAQAVFRANLREMYLGIVPFFHVYGLSTCQHMAIMTGSTIILLPRFQTAEVLRNR